MLLLDYTWNVGSWCVRNITRCRAARGDMS